MNFGSRVLSSRKKSGLLTILSGCKSKHKNLANASSQALYLGFFYGKVLLNKKHLLFLIANELVHLHF